MAVDHPRQYSKEDRARAVALAANVGPTLAAERLGIPQRTISNWMVRSDLAPVVQQVQHDARDALAEAHAEALAAVRAGLSDPRQRLGDRARALEVIGAQVERSISRDGIDGATPVGPIGDLVKSLAGLNERELLALMDALDSIQAGDALDAVMDGRIDSLTHEDLVLLVQRLTQALDR